MYKTEQAQLCGMNNWYMGLVLLDKNNATKCHSIKNPVWDKLWQGAHTHTAKIISRPTNLSILSCPQVTKVRDHEAQSLIWGIHCPAVRALYTAQTWLDFLYKEEFAQSGFQP